MTNGCNRTHCPCRTWLNCPIYVDKQRQEWRLKKKEYDFHLWYETYFRLDEKQSDVICNG